METTTELIRVQRKQLSLHKIDGDARVLCRGCCAMIERIGFIIVLKSSLVLMRSEPTPCPHCDREYLVPADLQKPAESLDRVQALRLYGLDPRDFMPMRTILPKTFRTTLVGKF